jgi:thiamine-phosphate pyrophosphorylase
MSVHGLYAVIDTTFSPQYSHSELAQLVLLGGCRLLQLRMKPLDLADSGDDSWRVFEEARKIMELKKKFDFTFIVNDYVDVAAEAGADGVHVGANDTPVEEIRRRLGGGYIIGYSSHSIEEALAAERRGADYIAFGAIFPTRTKGPGHPVQGLERLRALCSQAKRPIVAIGGINRDNIDGVISSGASAVAMITGLTQAGNVVEETRWYNVHCSYDSRL